MIELRLMPVPAQRLNAFTPKVLNEVKEKCGVKASVREGILYLEGSSEGEYFAEQVAHALCLGFELGKALKLLKEDFFIEEIDLELSVGDSKKKLERLKGRVIGAEGKSKKVLQELSGCDVSVWGNKIALIGRYEELQDAKQGIKKLLEGAQHSSVYAFLEKRKKMRD